MNSYTFGGFGTVVVVGAGVVVEVVVGSGVCTCSAVTAAAGRGTDDDGGCEHEPQRR